MGEGRFSVHLRVPLAQVSLHSFSKFVFRPEKKKVSYTTRPFVLITKPSLGAIHSTKIPTGPTGKSGPPQKVDLFFRNFSGRTEPIFGLMNRYDPKENFAKIWQSKKNLIWSVKFEIVRIDFKVILSVCWYPKILLPWQRDVRTSPLVALLKKPSLSLRAKRPRFRTLLLEGFNGI